MQILKTPSSATYRFLDYKSSKCRGSMLTGKTKGSNRHIRSPGGRIIPVCSEAPSGHSLPPTNKQLDPMRINSENKIYTKFLTNVWKFL